MSRLYADADGVEAGSATQKLKDSRKWGIKEIWNMFGKNLLISFCGIQMLRNVGLIFKFSLICFWLEVKKWNDRKKIYLVKKEKKNDGIKNVKL